MTEDEERRALALHEQQRAAIWSDPPTLLIAPERLGFTGKDDQFHEINRRPGRQEAWRNRNVRTFQSHEAAKFVHDEMRLFREQNGITRVRKFVRVRFWKIAKARYPAAEESIVWDHIRMNRKRPL